MSNIANFKEYCAAHDRDGRPCSERWAPPVELKGRSAYQPEDSHILFGRDRAIELILEHLQRLSEARLPSPIIAVAGSRGDGKSSVLRAGLVGRLGQGQYPRYGRFLPVLCDASSLDGPDPFSNFADSVAAHLPAPLWEGVHWPGDFPPSEQAIRFVQAVGKSLKAAPLVSVWMNRDAPLRLFVGLDHFEDLVAQAQEDPGRAQGLHKLLAALYALASQGLAWATLTLPVDRMQALRDLAPRWPFDTIELAPVSEDEVRDIVVRSCEAAGLGAETDFIEDVLAWSAAWRRQQETHVPILPLLSQLLTDYAAARRRDCPGVADHADVAQVPHVEDYADAFANPGAWETANSGLPSWEAPSWEPPSWEWDDSALNDTERDAWEPEAGQAPALNGPNIDLFDPGFRTLLTEAVAASHAAADPVEQRTMLLDALTEALIVLGAPPGRALSSVADFRRRLLQEQPDPWPAGETRE